MACVCSEGDLGHAGASEARQTNKHLSYLAQAQAWLERFKRFWKRHEKSIQVPGVTVTEYAGNIHGLQR